MAERARKEGLTVEKPSVVWTEPKASTFQTAFRARVKLAREGAGLTQVEMAERLGIRQDKYAKYESRSLLPHVYVARFCEVTGISEKQLFRDPR